MLSDNYLWFFKQYVIPLAETQDVPGEPPLSLPFPPEMPSIGTKSEIALSMESKKWVQIGWTEFKVKAYAERGKQEADRIGDR